MSLLYSHNEYINIPVKSFTTENIYNVSLKVNKNSFNFDLECSCGDRFNKGKRTNCKHIAHVIQHCIDNLFAKSDLVYNTNTIIPEEYENNLVIPVQSFASDNMYYVLIKNNKNNHNFDINCSCGTNFNLDKRTKCKHISFIVKSLIESHNNNQFISEFNNITI